MKACEFCSQPFAPKRPWARFCSDTCRVYAHRGQIANRDHRGPFLDWTPDETRRILAESDKLEGWCDNRIMRCAYARSVVLAMRDTGLTYHVLTAIHKGQLKQGVLRLDGHRYHLEPETVDAIRDTRPHEHNELFPWLNTRRDFYDMLQRLYDAADIPKRKRFPGPQIDRSGRFVDRGAADHAARVRDAQGRFAQGS